MLFCSAICLCINFYLRTQKFEVTSCLNSEFSFQKEGFGYAAFYLYHAYSTTKKPRDFFNDYLMLKIVAISSQEEVISQEWC